MAVMDFLTKWHFEVEERPLDQIQEKLEHIHHTLEFLAAAEVVKGIFELTEKFSGMGEQLNNAALSAGITVESLQGLHFAAAQAGVGAEEVDTAMARLSRTLYEARQGSQEATDTFARAGISKAQVMGFRTGADAMAALSDRMAGMSDPIAKQAIAMQLLGRGSFKMVGFLGQGSEEMRKLSAAAADMGAVMSQENVVALQEVEDALSAMFTTLKTATATIISYFAPGIRAAAQALTALYGANAQVIQLHFKKWAEDTMYAFGFVFGVVEGLTNKFMRFAAEHPKLVHLAGELVAALMGVALGAGVLGKFIDLAKGAVGFLGGGLETLFKPMAWAGELIAGTVRGLIAMIAKIGVLIAESFPGVSAALLRFSSFLAASPITLVVAGIAALIVVVHDLWTVLSGGAWKDTWLAKMWEGLKGAGKWVGGALGLDMGAPPQADGAAPGQAPGMDAAMRAPDGGASMLARLPQMMMQAPGMVQDPGSRMQAMAPGEQSVTVNSPITINGLPPGTDAANVAEVLKTEVQQQHAKLTREVGRSLYTAEAY